jgi:hypothetical protein
MLTDPPRDTAKLRIAARASKTALALRKAWIGL